SVDFGATYTLQLLFNQGTNPPAGISINWGDDTTTSVSGSQSLVTHQYSTRDPFQYTISATFTDADGVHIATNTIDVVVGGSLFEATDEKIDTPDHPNTARVFGSVGATLFLSTPGSEATVFVGKYKANPTGNLPDGRALVYTDVNLHFEVLGDSTTQLRVRFFLPAGVAATKIMPQLFAGSRRKAWMGD